LEEERWVITVIGLDRVGIVAGITAVLAEHNANILDIRQTLMEEFFTMLMMVDVSSIQGEAEGLQTALEKKGDELGVRVMVQHQDVFRFMHRI
jgi:ACT domain-containing protein